MVVADLEIRLSALEGEHPVDWNTLVNIPADFADEVDDIGLTADQEEQFSDVQVGLEDLKRLVGDGFIPIGTNPETGLEEYHHLQTGMEFVLLPGGTFAMGSPESEANRGDDEGPVHVVTLD